MFTEDVSLRRVELAQGYKVLKSGKGTGAPSAIGGVAWARTGREDAGLSAWYMKRHELVVDRVLEKGGFLMKEEDSG